VKTNDGKSQSHRPVVTQFFAAQEIRPGEPWKIYLRASDPGGEMKAIYATVDQPGRGPQSAGPIPVPQEQRRDLSGFLYLNTAGNPGSAFLNLTLTVQIQDRAGNYSHPISFPLALNPRAVQESPPLGVFEARALGPIMISLDPGTGGS